MRIMYIAPMFHTNQVPIIKGWVENGDYVTFINHYKGKTENHTYCTPIVLGYSSFFQFVYNLYLKMTAKKNSTSSRPEAFQDRFGYPSANALKNLLKEHKPELVILRERSIYSIRAYQICKRAGIPCILYNQTPLWDTEAPRDDLAHKLVRALTPSVRMTPVYGDEQTGHNDGHSYFVPFVIEPNQSPSEHVYFSEDKIRILCVGKYEPRKNQFMLLHILNELKDSYPMHLTFVGEMSTECHRQEFQKITQYIAEHHLEKYVSLHTNCKPTDMPAFYQNADLFILPSTGEFASISQLEAMSYSLPVIVSAANGTACYVSHDENGYLFEDNNESELMDMMLKLLPHRQKILDFGAASYQLVSTKYSFAEYRNHIEQLLALAKGK